jgi:ribose-phosphate pyrophosphokinase
MIDIHNNKYFDLFEFPGGEIGIKWKVDTLTLGGSGYSLLARINNGIDLLKLTTVVNAFKHMKCIPHLLEIPYFPGARQDRVADYGDPLSVEIYAEIINSLGFEEVEIVDPHSDVTPALIKNVNVYRINPIISQIVNEGGYNTILIPDAGAAKKTFSYYFPYPADNAKLKFVQCLKKRDTVTGKLTGFRIIDEIPQGARCLIVDDICDGGGTFLGLAQELTPFNPEILGLYVSHGIFSKGLEVLLEGGFDRIYTTNSIRSVDYNIPEVKVFNVL